MHHGTRFPDRRSVFIHSQMTLDVVLPHRCGDRKGPMVGEGLALRPAQRRSIRRAIKDVHAGQTAYPAWWALEDLNL
jgi:hypothetical protein